MLFPNSTNRACFFRCFLFHPQISFLFLILQSIAKCLLCIHGSFLLIPHFFWMVRVRQKTNSSFSSGISSIMPSVLSNFRFCVSVPFLFPLCLISKHRNLWFFGFSVGRVWLYHCDFFSGVSSLMSCFCLCSINCQSLISQSLI